MQYRRGRYSIKEVFAIIAAMPKNYGRKYKAELDGDMIKFSSGRLLTFYSKGTTCVRCGVEGAYFVKERNEADVSWHLNLYGIKNGKEVLITKDHIFPRAKGGKDHLSNYQTMCHECNQKKGCS